MALRTFRNFGGGSLYNDSFGYLDQNPHNTMHIWTGALNPNPAPDPESLRRVGRHVARGVSGAGIETHGRGIGTHRRDRERRRRSYRRAGGT